MFRVGAVVGMVVGLTNVNVLREQALRTRVLFLEDAMRRFLASGDRTIIEDAYSNEWVRPLEVDDEPTV